jgi:hypothetical protein
MLKRDRRKGKSQQREELKENNEEIRKHKNEERIKVAFLLVRYYEIL